MTLSSGAHVKLGDYEFKIDKDVENHYLHRYYDITADKLQIAGTSGKEQLLPDSIMWTMDDWAGGEGNNIFYADEFDIYYSSGALNPRVRGQLTVRPARTKGAATGGPPAVCGGGWIGRISAYDALVTVEYFNTVSLAWSSWFITGAVTVLAGDSSYIYALAPTSVVRCLANTTFEDAESITADSNAWVGAAVLEGKLYGWDGSGLWEFDVNNWSSWASDHYRKVYDGGYLPDGTWNTNWYGDLIATENSLIFWRTDDGVSEVFEYRNGVGRPLWKAPMGFSLRSTCYQNGIVYFAGHWGAPGEGWGALYALPLDSMRPIFLKWVGRLENLKYTLPRIAPSYGNQVLIASGNRKIYVYDTETNGLSILDDIDGETITDVFTFGDGRFAQGGSTYRYDDDEPAERETGFNYTDLTDLTDATLTSAKWDLDYPMETKGLTGFHVACAPMLSGQYILISYRVDGGSWVDLPVINASTTGASTGRVYVAAPTGGSTASFYSLQFRVRLTSDTGVLGPILYSVTAESVLTRKVEEWELIIRLKDEQSRERPSHRQSRGADLRDWLLTTVTAGQNLTFLDGFRYPNDNEYSTHTVTVKEVTDLIAEEGEGVCRVVLRATTEGA